MKLGKTDMLLLFSGEGSTDIGSCQHGRKGLCEPGQWKPGSMAHLATEILECLHPCGRSWLDEAYFFPETALIELSKAFKSPQLIGKGQSIYHSRLARTLGCVARHLADRHKKKVIPIFFRDGSSGGKLSDREYNKIRASINGEKQGFRQLSIKTGVAMMPRPVSEVWLLCALQKNSYQSCEKLEQFPPKDENGICQPKKMLAERLAVRKNNPSDLPDLIQNKIIDCSKIKMPSYCLFFEDMHQAVMACVHDDWCDAIDHSMRVSCAKAIDSHKAWF